MVEPNKADLNQSSSSLLLIKEKADILIETNKELYILTNTSKANKVDYKGHKLDCYKCGRVANEPVREENCNQYFCKLCLREEKE